MTEPSRGEVWYARLDDKPPAVGHEQAGRRPILIFSADRFNKSPAGLVIALTITSKAKGVPWHIEIKPPEGGIDTVSFIMCEAIRTISKERLLEYWGKVSPSTIKEVDDRVKVLLAL
jgi:mRNA interferase MazF